MKYTNPVLKGFYPDPSVCFADGKYYMVCSSFQYFPGVPLFESEDLVNWTQIGHVLTRKNQIMLSHVESSGGVFAPTIRYHDGRFYMVTTNNSTQTNFYVYTDDIHKEWSDPVPVAQGGIDPSLYFEDGRTFFISNGTDDSGIYGIVQCEIDIATGRKLTESKCIWQGSGGRFIESPHMYKIHGEYYLMVAEGGTEYGHMITYARGSSVWGPFQGYPDNPVLTNRNKAPYIIQGIGHGELVTDPYGDWHILSLGFRQIHLWQAYHTLGREVFLTPVTFHEDGWFTAGKDKTTDESYEIKGDFLQKPLKSYSFDTTNPAIDWCYLRHPYEENYTFGEHDLTLYGTELTLEDVDSPTFVGFRQRDFCFEMYADLMVDHGEGGITVYSTENEHYDIAVLRTLNESQIVFKRNIGGIKHLENAIHLPPSNTVRLIIKADSLTYSFYAVADGKEVLLGTALSKYVSTEVSGGFTGVILAFYAIGNNEVCIKDFQIKYLPQI